MAIDEALMTDQEIRAIVDKWFPINPNGLSFAYKNNIKEYARDFAFHIAGAQLSKTRKLTCPTNA